MTPVRAQPILFSSTDLPTGSSPDYVFSVPDNSGCCPSEVWCQQVYDTDTISFQFDAPSCASENQVIDNFDFTDPDTNSNSQTDWSGTVNAFNIGGSGARFDSDNEYISQVNAGIVDSNWYKLQVRVNVVNATDSAPVNIVVTGFEQDIIIPAADGLYEFYVQALSSTSIRLTRQDIVSTDDFVYIQWVALYEITEPEIVPLNYIGEQLSTEASSIIRDGRYVTVTFYIDTNIQSVGRFRIGAFRTCDGEAWISEEIVLTSDISCTIQIGGCGDSSFQSGQLTARLNGLLVQDQANEFDRFITQDSKGKYRNNYTKMNRLWSLYIEMIPAHLRDWINWLTGYNTIAVKQPNGQSQEYFVLSEPEAPVFADRHYQLAKMKVTLVPKEELNESVYNGDCTVVLPPKALGERRGGGIAIESGVDQGINAE